ncbi:hypothetical protein [Adhaeribacter aquaticus]|uniref:hypothetical protein n=1 Tax=Adhaeribacter aquaticus TaxID=299567 RepID=UPI0003F88DD4|nr:hypothetical protein [Adhaeribacter aquaticus]
MEKPLNPVQWVKEKLLQLQNNIVRYLERKEKGLTLAQKKVYFFLFIFCGGGFFLFSLVSGLAGYSQAALQVTPIKRALVQHPVLKQDSLKKPDPLKVK